MDIIKHEDFYDYVDIICELLNVKMTVKDLIRFNGIIDYDLSMFMLKYINHQNSYCRIIKSDDRLHKKCLYMHKALHRKCHRLKKTFYGVCHAGVGEYIVPVCYKDMVIGFLCIGSYQADAGTIMKRRKILDLKYGIDREYRRALEAAYGTLNNDVRHNCEIISKAFGMIAWYISNAFAQNIHKYEESVNIKDLKVDYAGNAILERLLDHIHTNFREQINAETLSELCKCSVSYINHIFKKSTGRNLRDYINQIRIIESAKLLAESKKIVSNNRSAG